MTLTEPHPLSALSPLPGLRQRSVRVPRVALYSHDTQGLGHIRRNLSIAGALSRSEPRPDVLLVSGAHQARAFRLPPGTDVLTLPALCKDADGAYGARSLSSSLDELVALRSAIMRAALESYAPDILVVDKVARGAQGELEPTLAALRAGGRTRIVLGLRDVLDSPERTRLEWRRDGTNQAIRDYYDEVWVYGDREVFDPVTEYGLEPDIAARIRFTGYLGHGRAAASGDDQAPGEEAAEGAGGGTVGSGDEPYALCLVGGGQDGYEVAAAFLEAPLPDGMGAVVVTGPFLPPHQAAHLQRLADERPGRQVLGFVADCGPLVRGAAGVVAMGGYNTVCELLAEGVHPLVVPRVLPREEQLVRAERLAARGLVDLLHPESLGPGTIANWLADPPGPGGRRSGADRRAIDLDGLDRLPGLAQRLIAEARVPAEEVFARVAV